MFMINLICKIITIFIFIVYLGKYKSISMHLYFNKNLFIHLWGTKLKLIIV